MSEHVPIKDRPHIPIDSDVPLAYLELADENGYQTPLYIMDTPELAGRYVIRCMGSEYSSTLQNLSLADRYAIYNRELGRLRGFGVSIPHVYAGLPKGYESIVPSSRFDRYYEDVVLVAERIIPMAIAAEKVAMAQQQARRTIAGLAGYLQSSWTAERQVSADSFYLNDVFAERQFIYGTPFGRDEPDFYMVDVGAEFGDAKSKSTMPGRQVVVSDTAKYFGGLAADPNLHGYARGLLFGGR